VNAAEHLKKCQPPLSSVFVVAGRSETLAVTEHVFVLVVELRRITVIVFDGVPVALDPSRIANPCT
jgi:hypothetical protein